MKELISRLSDKPIIHLRQSEKLENKTKNTIKIKMKKIEENWIICYDL